LGFGTFAREGAKHLGFRSGETVVDLGAGSLDELLRQGRAAWERATEQALAGAEAGDAIPLDEIEPLLPFTVADYVDFYSSLEHATNLGRLFRPDSEPLLPNWRHLPVGYHGRAGTVVVAGTDVVRPSGQSKPPGAADPLFGPSCRLDIELELGFVVGVPSRLGEPVPAERFAEHVFGVVLVNDWSARDLQAWEYQPLGPFLGKSFATSISAWVTPLALLDGARTQAPPQEPAPLEYLAGGRDWALDVALEVELNGQVVSRTNAAGLYWTMPQQLAHATSNGASLRTGDLMASGTISGAERGSEGSLIELTCNGAEPLRLDDRSERTFLEDGDEVVLRGRGVNGVELGEVRGRVLPATRAGLLDFPRSVAFDRSRLASGTGMTKER
jgi:fumarylacetoacetase